MENEFAFLVAHVLMFKTYPSSSSSLWPEPGVDRYIGNWELGFQIYRELE